MPRRRRAQIGSFGQVVLDYQQSPEFRDLSPGTREIYLRAMAHMAPLYDCNVRDIRRRHIRVLRDHLADTPAAANQVVMMASLLLWRAVEDELIDANPVSRMKRLEMGQHARWSDAQVAYALEHLGEGYRRAILLALHTGQRQADVLAMRWDDIDGDVIRVTQAKTGAALAIPIVADLRALLDAWAKDRRTLTILATDDGRPRQPPSFKVAFAAAIRRHPQLQGCTFHGLRVTAATRLAEAGATIHEIASVTGHRTLSMVQHYTRETEQEGRARAAMEKLRTAQTRNVAQVVDLKR